MSVIQGNTIWLRRTFTSRTGEAYDPTDIELKLFNLQRNQIGETISVGAEHKIDLGVYEVPVVLPEGHDMIVYEFSGKDADGNPDVLRKAIRTPWAE